MRRDDASESVVKRLARLQQAVDASVEGGGAAGVAELLLHLGLDVDQEMDQRRQAALRPLRIDAALRARDPVTLAQMRGALVEQAGAKAVAVIGDGHAGRSKQRQDRL